MRSSLQIGAFLEANQCFPCCESVRSLALNNRPSLKNIQTILASGQDKVPDEKREAEKKPESQYGFTRGADYYEGRMK